MTPRRPVAKAAEPAPIDLNPRTDPPLDFPRRELREMTPDDWRALGFLCGLEVHQQLLTRTKLFCRCPAGVRLTRVDAEVLRHMRPTLSELGQYDGTALMEFKTRKEIVYQVELDSVCTYEIDDTPPFPIDPQAVKIALEVSRLFDLNLASELQVMRKQYLDGSIPTGFQRTAMVGLGGSIPWTGNEAGVRELRIRQLTLEEDSCREVSDVGHRITFRTDRLGMPLVETVTEPDLLTPRDAEAGGRLIAAVARSSGKVRRGLGAARQDVNVSIAGSRRVELKGVPRLGLIPLLVHNEAFRHLNLLRVRAELTRRGVERAQLVISDTEPALGSPLAVDATRVAASDTWKPLAEAVERGDVVGAVRLPGFGGLLAHETQPGLTFAHELSERVRVIACPSSRPFFACSDDARGPGELLWSRVREVLRAERGDALVLVWGTPDDVDTGVREVLIRASDALVGVPSETRQAFRDGRTGFERILPGPERMYPDTDTPPFPIPDAWLAEIEAHMPERPWERESRYARLGLDVRAAKRLAAAPWSSLFDALAPQSELGARRLAAGLEKRLVHHRRKSGVRALPDAARLAPLVRAVDEARLRPEAFEAVLDRLLLPGGDPERIVASRTPRSDDDTRLCEAVEEALDLAPRYEPARLVRWAMGRVAPEFLGRVAPSAVRECIEAALGERAESPR